MCFACTALLPGGFISGFLPISALGSLGCAIALAPLGTALLCSPSRDHGRPFDPAEPSGMTTFRG